MKERPILFNGEMVRAILEGRKTQTRRVVKPQPEFAEMPEWFTMSDGTWRVVEEEYPEEGSVHYRCPYGQPGDRLWVRETWQPIQLHDTTTGKTMRNALYREGNEIPFIDRWRPSIHMPRWASRITLEITNVRVERLEDISGWDVRAEGVETWMDVHPDIAEVCLNYKDNFYYLWNSINAKRGFGSN